MGSHPARFDYNNDMKIFLIVMLLASLLVQASNGSRCLDQSLNNMLLLKLKDIYASRVQDGLIQNNRDGGADGPAPTEEACQKSFESWEDDRREKIKMISKMKQELASGKKLPPYYFNGLNATTQHVKPLGDKEICEGSTAQNENYIDDRQKESGECGSITRDFHVQLLRLNALTTPVRDLCVQVGRLTQQHDFDLNRCKKILESNRKFKANREPPAEEIAPDEPSAKPITRPINTTPSSNPRPNSSRQ
jgi:hypothetical protein